MKRKNLILILCCITLYSCQEDDIIIPAKTLWERDSMFLNLKNNMINPSIEGNTLDYLFDINSLPVITLLLNKDDWNKYLTNFDSNPDTRQYVPTRFVFQKDGHVWYRDSIGIRPRGNTSRVRPEGNYGEPHDSINADWHHAHFNLKFPDKNTFMGTDRMVLKCFMHDPAYCREIYCYDLMKRFGLWSAPRASYCRLYISIDGDLQPTYFGIYEMVEGVHKTFLDDRKKRGYISDKNFNLWKASPWHEKASFFNPNPLIMGIENDESATNHTYTYTLKTNKSKLYSAQNELCNFIINLQTFDSGSDELHKWLENNVDIDLFLKYTAICVITGSWDDYWNRGNNFYFFFDQNHKMHIIPWDFDNTLGNISMPDFDSGTHDVLNWGGFDNDQILISQILSIPQYKKLYISYIKQLINTTSLFDPQNSQQRIHDFHSIISSHIVNDTDEDMIIRDNSVEWSDPDYYKLLSGDSVTNFFLAKIKSIYF